MFNTRNRLLKAGIAMAGLAVAFPGTALAQTVDEAVEIAAPPAAQVPEGSVGGMGDVNLFPKRIVISGRQRIATVGLYNKEAAIGEYEIAVTDMVMMPDGQLVNMDKVADPAQKSKVNTASQMLRWSPRRVALQANESQTVRVMARKPADLPDGEYRSHFVVISTPQEVPGGLSIGDALGGEQGDGIGVQIRPRFGISIPVIVRVGDTTLESGVRDIALVPLTGGGTGLKMVITRSGTRSSFGDIEVTAAGFSTPVATALGVGVYPEVDARQVVIPLDPEMDPGAMASGRTWTITYTDDDFAPGDVLFRQTFIVP